MTSPAPFAASLGLAPLAGIQVAWLIGASIPSYPNSVATLYLFNCTVRHLTVAVAICVQVLDIKLTGKGISGVVEIMAFLAVGCGLWAVGCGVWDVGCAQCDSNEVAVTLVSQYLVEYKIPGRVSISARQKNRVLPIDQKIFNVERVARTVAEIETSAYLLARFDFPEDIPFEQGTMQLYRDGSFIGSNFTSALLPGEKIDLTFGIDERIRVEVMEDATPGDVTDFEGKSGMLMWKLKANSQKTKLVKHYVKIVFPKDTELDFD